MGMKMRKVSKMSRCGDCEIYFSGRIFKGSMLL